MSQMMKKNAGEKRKKESNKKIFGRPQKLQKQNPLFIAQVHKVLIKVSVIMQFLDYLFSHEDLEDLEDFNLPKDALQLAKMARFGRDRDGRNVLSILLDWKNVKAFVKGTFRPIESTGFLSILRFLGEIISTNCAIIDTTYCCWCGSNGCRPIRKMLWTLFSRMEIYKRTG